VEFIGMKLDFTRALVTGGAGFIGSHLVDALLEAGCRVTVIDNLATGRMENLSGVLDRINFIEGDILDESLLNQAADGCEVVFHQAAVVSVPKTVEDPVGSAAVNDLGTVKVLEAARKAGSRRVVLASSSAVYGDDPALPKNEGMAPKPLTPYAVEKLVGEYNARLFNDLYGLETVCLRYFNVYGPRQDPSSPYSGVISIFMARAAGNASPTLYGNGRQFRDFVFVQDVVAANLLSATVPGAGGSVLNVGTGNHVTINRLWEMVQALSGCEMPAEYAPARTGDIQESVADIGQAAERIGFAPACGFEAGLEKTFKWFKGSE
jgi:UDP-glucose 4-epimerase